MKEHIYLVSSLPTLRIGDKPPMGAEAFRAACTGWLSDDELDAVDAALENRAPTQSGVASAWWNGEVQLRDAVVRVRSKNRGVEGSSFIKPYEGFSATIEKMVTDAFTRPDPLEQEMELDRARWSLIEDLTLTAPFGFAAVLAFAVKVRIAERWAQMDEEAGKQNVEQFIEAALAEPNNQ
ncbi:MAG TPA: DUF2764 family protein [Tichowtungia sp.]|nr:DUF2764 family protein [Tichowtungia sp.]